VFENSRGIRDEFASETRFLKISQIFKHLHWNISMRILREFAVKRLRRRISRAFFELELILFFLRRHEFTRLRDINTKLLRHLFDPDDDNNGDGQCWI